MKAMERLSKAINALEEELDEIDRVLDPLAEDRHTGRIPGEPVGNIARREAETEQPSPSFQALDGSARHVA